MAPLGVLLLLLLLLLLPHAATTQPAAFTGNHALSTPDAGWSAVTLNPAQFGVFLSPLGRGELTLTVNGAQQPLRALNWSGDAVYPGGALQAAFAGVDLTLRSFAPLSPFDEEAGFLPLLLAELTAASPAAPATVSLAYTFYCSGLYSACAGGGGAPAPAPAPAPALPGDPALATAAQVFLGAALGDANTAAAQGCAPLPPGSPAAPARERPRRRSRAAPPARPLRDPPLHFTQVGGNGTGITCPFGGWGEGASLAACETSCVEDAACNAVNWSPAISDCVFRVCPPLPQPPPSAPAPGYTAYATTAAKPPRPLLCAATAAALPAGAPPRRLLLALGQHQPTGRYAAAFPSPQALFAHAVGAGGELAAAHAAFTAALPSTGSAPRDASVRWLTAPAVLLTKGVGGQASTMGYVEMCSRDSFWTTWLHAYMWPGLDGAMVREFAAWQCNGTVPACGGARNDGKIPTTILPAIYREDNIDITAYYVLRAARYLQGSGQAAELAELYPSLRRALLYLLRRSDGGRGGGLPAANASSQWADWLDVDYMVGRKWAPHFVAVHLAALGVGAAAAGALGEGADAALFASARAAGLAFMLAPVACDAAGGGCGGGMWNASGGYLQDVWWDASRRNYTLSDQFVAALLGVTDEAHNSALLAHLLGASGNNGPGGLRDFYPYFPHASDPPAVYGNGGAYLWINCGAVAALLAQGGAGAEASAWALWDKVTAASLYSPSLPALHQSWEYLNGDTAAAMGAAPFGGDGACFAVAQLGGRYSWGLAQPPVAVVPVGGWGRGEGAAAAAGSAGSAGSAGVGGGGAGAPAHPPVGLALSTVEESDLVRVGDIVLGVAGMSTAGMDCEALRRAIAAARAATAGSAIVLHLADCPIVDSEVEEASVQMAAAAASLLGGRGPVEGAWDAMRVGLGYRAMPVLFPLKVKDLADTALFPNSAHLAQELTALEEL